MHLRADLSLEAASRICARECRAACCRGALLLRLSSDEVATLKRRALELSVELNVRAEPDGGGSVRFLEHPGEHCPMLDDASSTCRIYDERPQRCREFPEKLRPGCAISGG